MSSHLRANLWLLLFTVVVCSVLYPLVLFGFGQAFFRHHAEGSLIDAEGNPVTDPKKAVGSRLIAQAFKGDEYFQPRPSAAGSDGYDASASGASNWGASNYRLRNRVARQLGPIVRYGPGAARDGKKPGELVGRDIQAWFRKDRYRGKPGIVAQWANAHPGLAADWVKQDKASADFVARWQAAHPQEVARWVKDNPQTPEPKPEDLAVPFFESFSKTHPGAWPVVVEKAVAEKTEKRVEVVERGSDIQSVFFDLWRQEHPDIDLEAVPADLVMASGSGLDPDITLANARYQLKYRVAIAWADKLLRPLVEGRVKAAGKSVDEDARKKIEEKVSADVAARLGKPLEQKVREVIEPLLESRKHAPLGGLVGVDLVNVLEVNLAVNARMKPLATEILVAEK
jgi:K+-transporting ATPase ATPase C chain